jgi:hypothetical protein
MTRWMVAGLMAGGLLLTSACSQDRAARRGDTTEAGTGGSGSQVDPGVGIYKDYDVPQEDRASTGGSGYRDAVTNPNASDTSKSKSEDVRDQDPAEERGTGGSGYEKDSELFERNQEFGGSSFPGDKAVPQRL